MSQFAAKPILLFSKSVTDTFYAIPYNQGLNFQGCEGYFRDTGFGENFRRDSGNAQKFNRDSGKLSFTCGRSIRERLNSKSLVEMI